MPTFFDNTRISHWQNIARRNLLVAFERARKRHRLTAVDRHRIKPHGPEHLLAVNSGSRVNWGRAVCGELARFFCNNGDGTKHNQEILFVTLCDVRCVKSLEPLTQEGLSRIKDRLRYGLRGLNYLAVIEPALYLNWKIAHQRGEKKRCVSWHLHGVVWGIAKERMQKRLRKLRREGWYGPLERGLRPTQVQVVKPGRLPRAVGYLLKSPISAYRVSAVDWIRDGKEVVDESGEVQRKFKQSKSELRPGEQLILYFNMRRLYLDELALAGGEGRPLIATAKRLTRPRPAPSPGLPYRLHRRTVLSRRGR